MNNQMLNNNPLYSSNIYDQSFYHQMMLQREEQLRKIKNISDLNLSKEQITEYVIAPIKVEKSDTGEIKKLFDDEEQRLTQKFIEDNWWSQRTNAPYKNILKDQDWKKDFKKEDDLIVHKYSNLDKIGLMKEYETILKLIEHHNGELKVVFSASKESEYKKSFKFVQKYRGRLKYNPKDYNELKDYYDKEQKKFGREQKRIDDVISRIMDDDMDDKELKQIESDFLKPSKSQKIKPKYKNRESELDRQIQELIDEFGEEVLKELEEGSHDDDDGDKQSYKNDKIKSNHNSREKKTSNYHDEHDSDKQNTKVNPKENRIRIRRIIKEDTNSHPNESSTNYKNTEIIDNKRIRIKRIDRNIEDKIQTENNNTIKYKKRNSDISSNNNQLINIQTDSTIRRIKIGRKTQK
jgi:hypothetical protein